MSKVTLLADGDTGTEPKVHLTLRAVSSLLSWAWHTCWCSLCHPSCSPPPFMSTGVHWSSSQSLGSPYLAYEERGCLTLQAPDSHSKRLELEYKLGWFPCKHLSFFTVIISRAIAVHLETWNFLLKYLQNQMPILFFLLHPPPSSYFFS